MADMSEKVKDIIEKELGVEREKLTNEASFIEDLGADSLDIVELVMEFEKDSTSTSLTRMPRSSHRGRRGSTCRRSQSRNEASGRRHGSGVIPGWK
jgi:hypothetical protein